IRRDGQAGRLRRHREGGDDAAPGEIDDRDAGPRQVGDVGAAAIGREHDAERVAADGDLVAEALRRGVEEVDETWRADRLAAGAVHRAAVRRDGDAAGATLGRSARPPPPGNGMMPNARLPRLAM